MLSSWRGCRLKLGENALWETLRVQPAAGRASLELNLGRRRNSNGVKK